jgi:Zn-dependent protease
VLRFHLGPFPVTLEASFLITAVLLSGLGGSPLEVALWVVVVFVSVLVHELGHALVGLWLGGKPEIVLQGLGGVTFPRLRTRPGALQQILLSIAGPAFGLLPGAAAWALKAIAPPEPGSLMAGVLADFMITSVMWAVLNLVPVLPLDGGQVMESVISGLRRKPSVVLASWVSAVIGAGLALVAMLVFRQWFIALFFAAMAFSNLARARAGGAAARGSRPGTEGSPDAPARAEIERELLAARAALGSGDVDGALLAADRLESGADPFRQAAGLRIRAGVELSRGDAASAGLHAGRSFSLWPNADAAVVAARANLRLGEEARARTWLRRALEAGAPPEAIGRDPELGALVA